MPSSNARIHPIEIVPPDIRRYERGNTGIDYVTSFDSGVAGPHAMIAGLVHGNEICGAIALDFLFRNEVRPTKGRLTLAFMNVAAYWRFDATNPVAARFIDEDFNRVWDMETLDGRRDSVELARARELRPILDSVDVLLDIHSMQHRAKPLMLCGSLSKGRDLGLGVGVPQVLVMDEGHVSGRRMRGIYGERRAHLEAAIAKHLGGMLTLVPGGGGLQLSAWLPRDADDRRAEARAHQAGVAAYALSRYALAPLDRGGLFLGYGTVDLNAIEPAVARLGRAITRGLG